MSTDFEVKEYQDLLDLYATFDNEKLKELNHVYRNHYELDPVGSFRLISSDPYILGRSDFSCLSLCISIGAAIFMLNITLGISFGVLKFLIDNRTDYTEDVLIFFCLILCVFVSKKFLPFLFELLSPSQLNNSEYHFEEQFIKVENKPYFSSESTYYYKDIESIESLRINATSTSRAVSFKMYNRDAEEDRVCFYVGSQKEADWLVFICSYRLEYFRRFYQQDDFSLIEKLEHRSL